MSTGPGDMYSLLYHLTIVLHFLFIIFVVLGGLLVIRYHSFAFFHLPAAIWGAWIEFSGGICPLTPWENRFRMLAGESTYRGDFIVHYLSYIIYPERITTEIQYLLGTFVVIVNLAFYGIAIHRHIKKPT
jgi:hypothetical protein